MFVLKLALRPWRKTPFSQLMTASAVGLLLFLGGLLFWFESSLGPAIDRVQRDQVLTAYLSPEVTDPKTIVDEVKVEVGSSGVEKADVTFVDAKEFIAQIGEEYPRLGGELLNLGAEMNEVVPRYVTIVGYLSPSLIDRLRGLAGVEGVELSSHRYRYLMESLASLRWVVRVLMIGLGIALFTGLLHLARSNAHAQQDAVSILRFWGATPLTIRLPNFIGTLSVALLGGVFACGGWFSLGSSLSQEVEMLFPLLKNSAHSTMMFCLGFMLLALVLGLFSGGLAGQAAQPKRSP